MSEDRAQILKMLADGKINVEEAERLLNAIGESDQTSSEIGQPQTRKGSLKYLHVVVDTKRNENGKAEKVNVRVPIQLLRAGIKFSSLIPDHARNKVDDALNEKGINFDFKNLKPENIEELITALSELTVNIDSEDEKVRIYCE